MHSLILAKNITLIKCPGLESNQHDPKVTSPSS